MAVDQPDVSELDRACAGRGTAALPRAALPALLLSGYATGKRSSRRIERATYDSVFGMGFRQFLLPGLKALDGEWRLVSIAWNLRRMHTMRLDEAGHASSRGYNRSQKSMRRRLRTPHTLA